MWVAVDRGLRLADKRSLPLPQRNVWLETRDKIYGSFSRGRLSYLCDADLGDLTERVMEKAWNKKEKFFAQSFEVRLPFSVLPASSDSDEVNQQDINIVDSAVL